MAWLFSKRCKDSLAQGKLKVTLSRPVRRRLWRALGECDERTWRVYPGGFNEETTFLDELDNRVKSELGCEHLLAYPEEEDGGPVPSDMKGFILRGSYPPNVFDALELFYTDVGDENKALFQHCFNEIMEESGLAWRMADGRVFPVASTYIEEEISRRAYSLLREVKFHGALQEFERARADLANGDYEGAIHNANLAVESTIKGIIGVERAKPGELFRKLIDSGTVPQYYSGFLQAFERNILRCVAEIRNRELGVGHGQGAEVHEVPPALAELAVHLAAVLMVFLVNRHLEHAQGSSDVLGW